MDFLVFMKKKGSGREKMPTISSVMPSTWPSVALLTLQTSASWPTYRLMVTTSLLKTNNSFRFTRRPPNQPAWREYGGPSILPVPIRYNSQVTFTVVIKPYVMTHLPLMVLILASLNLQTKLTHLPSLRNTAILPILLRIIQTLLTIILVGIPYDYGPIQQLLSLILRTPKLWSLLGLLNSWWLSKET
eukprot:Lithocolla_globosa_v1_NODE_954_length_3037_cov_9.991952.p3 type:complete len:188 gc:universal NODE_954_length_3037_cov_9.991952:650-1213(+)